MWSWLQLLVKSLQNNNYINWTRTRKYVKRYGFLSFVRKYKIQLLDTGLVLLKTALKKVVHKVGEFLENKITDAVIKQ